MTITPQLYSPTQYRYHVIMTITDQLDSLTQYQIFIPHTLPLDHLHKPRLKYDFARSLYFHLKCNIKVRFVILFKS